MLFPYTIYPTLRYVGIIMHRLTCCAVLLISMSSFKMNIPLWMIKLKSIVFVYFVHSFCSCSRQNAHHFKWWMGFHLISDYIRAIGEESLIASSKMIYCLSESMRRFSWTLWLASHSGFALDFIITLTVSRLAIITGQYVPTESNIHCSIFRRFML